MPTLSLLDDANASDDGWHRVRSPGGYEWWQFDAEDPATEIQFVADFVQGNPFDAEYCRRFAAYRSRPRRNMPPTPAEYPAIRLAVYEKNACLWQGTKSFKPAEFGAKSDCLSVHIGPNYVESKDSGFALHLESDVRADLVFERKEAGQSLPMGTPDNRWIVASPMCDVRGQISFRDRTIHFAGRGSHEHRYATASPAGSMRTWLRCRILDENLSAFLELAVARAEVDGQVCRGAIVRDGESSQLIDLPVLVEWKSRGIFGREYPASINLGHRLALGNPREVCRTKSELTLLYDGFVDGQSAAALAQIANFEG